MSYFSEGKIVLDIGGGLGFAKKFFPNCRSFIVADPLEFSKHVSLMRQSPSYAVLRDLYPFVEDESIIYLACNAEYLPVRSNSIDLVHIRSALDHFSDPDVALREVRRVLKYVGTLIVGTLIVWTSLVSSTQEVFSVARKVKGLIRKVLVAIKLREPIEDHDHHTWHPTRENIQRIFTNSGFKIQNVVFQPSFGDRVQYFELKPVPLRI